MNGDEAGPDVHWMDVIMDLHGGWDCTADGRETLHSIELLENQRLTRAVSTGHPLPNGTPVR